MVYMHSRRVSKVSRGQTTAKREHESNVKLPREIFSKNDFFSHPFLMYIRKLMECV